MIEQGGGTDKGLYIKNQLYIYILHFIIYNIIFMNDKIEKYSHEIL